MRIGSHVRYTSAVLFLSVSCASGRTAPSPAGQANPTRAARQRVETADQLPRHVYPVATTATTLFQDSAQFAALARRLDADLRADLAAYDIQDRATLKSYYGTLSNLALLKADYRAAVAYQDSIRAIEDKPGVRLTTGMVERAMAAAAREPSARIDSASFRTALRREIAIVPYARARAELAMVKSRYSMLSPSIVAGAVQAQIEPAARSGSISRELAQQLVSLRVVATRIMPVRQVVIDELGETIAAHSVEKPDIWAARDVSLDRRADLTPVVVGIWDTGVDVSVFPAQLFTNAAEIPDNGKDDDGNGWVDDVHGIAHDIDGNRSTGMLFQLSFAPGEETQYRGLVKGLLDMQAGLENSDAAAFRQKIAGTAPSEVKPFLEKLVEYMVWSHGTHVTGIALRGNPAARVLVARDGTDQFKMPPHPPTLDEASKQAQAMRETIEYFRQRGVRVVNMSWGFGPDFFERDLEANNVGRSAEERRKLAHQIFDIDAKALHDAMAAASDILFVVAAGNWDSDNKFGEFAPAAFDLPNLITAAAVDRGGDEWALTSYGKVDVYANGYEVRSKVPGGYEIPLSGTSMAAPQVVNLAAKLLALKPGLNVAELRRAIVESADEKTIGEGKKIRLLNPKAAVERIGVSSDLVLQNVHVFDAVQGRFSDLTNVVVGDGVIRAVGRADAPTSAKRIEGNGGYVLPGLWDSHVHLAFVTLGGPDSVASVLKQFVQHGILYVRDVGGPLDVMARMHDRIAGGELLGPEIFFAGPMAEHSPMYWADRNKVLPGFTVPMDTPEQVDSLVSSVAVAGGSMIKAFGKWDLNLLRRLLVQAQQHSLRVVLDPGAPLFQSVPVDTALALGITSIEHAQAPGQAALRVDLARTLDSLMRAPTLPDSARMAFMRTVVPLGRESLDLDRLNTIAQTWRERGAVFTPTLRVFDAQRRDPPKRPGLSPEQLARLNGGAWDIVSTIVRTVASAGVTLLVGQDGIDPTGAAEEMAVLVANGVAPAKVLQAATINPARWLGRDDLLGSIAPGKRADLVLLKTNPLDSIEAVRTPSLVIQAGKVVFVADLASPAPSSHSIRGRPRPRPTSTTPPQPESSRGKGGHTPG